MMTDDTQASFRATTDAFETDFAYISTRQLMTRGEGTNWTRKFSHDGLKQMSAMSPAQQATQLATRLVNDMEDAEAMRGMDTRMKTCPFFFMNFQMSQTRAGQLTMSTNCSVRMMKISLFPLTSNWYLVSPWN